MFDWVGHHDPEIWVAILTGVLAGATFLLALFTAWTAKLSRSGVAVAIRPLIVDAPLGVFLHQQLLPSGSVRLGSSESPPTTIVDTARTAGSVSNGLVEIRLAIRNAGSGPALIDASRITSVIGTSDAAGTPTPDLATSHTVLPVGEAAQLHVAWRLPEDQASEPDHPITPANTLWKRLRSVQISVYYSDMNGAQKSKSELTWRRKGESWQFARATIYRRRLGRYRKLASLSRPTNDEASSTADG